MHNVTESTATVNFHLALIEATGRALAKYPQESVRIAKAVALVEADAVTDCQRLRPRAFRVRSTSHPATQYDVVSNSHTTCTCQDYLSHVTHDVGFLCKHGFAVLLVRSLQHDAWGHKMRHCYHMASGEEGHGRRLVGGRAVFHPGGHAHGFVCMAEELCFGPYLSPSERTD
jgi:SWIM zinc finger